MGGVLTFEFLITQLAQMANTSKPGSHPDDDSWGKIASDLFGIQFNDDDDFELPDEDRPTKSQPEPPVQEAPVAQAAEIERRDEGVPQEDLVEPVGEPAKAAVPGDEDHDEFWDILESWNWDEPAKAAAKPARTEEPQARRPRPEPAAPEARRSRHDEPPRRDDKRRDSGERPRRRDAEFEETSAGGGQSGASRPAREEGRRDRPPRGEKGQRPRRSDAERGSSEQSAVERRPERSADRPRSREVPAASAADDFGSGVDESVEASRPRQSSPPRRRDEPPARKPAPPKRNVSDEDFEGDLFVDDLEDDVEDIPFGSEAESSDELSSDSDDAETGRPRRRRRRRRRGRGRSVADSSATRDPEFDSSDDEVEESVEEEAELDDSETDVAEDAEERDDDRDSRRPRRRKRRRGRRPEPASSVDRDVADLEDEGIDDDVADELGEHESDSDEEEAVVPISYEGIPTWEEAISYLVIVPPTESRGNRGRGDGHRRDDSRRR